MDVLLTGSSGFIGSAIASFLINHGYKIKVLVREKNQKFGDKISQSICDFENLDDLSTDIFLNTDCVIHTAARVHITRDGVNESLIEYRKVNRDATLILARFAAVAGVKRFIFISSIGVNGRVSNRPFTEVDGVEPHDPYSLSKFEAEQGLFKIAEETGLEVVVIRPPLVYGANAPGNFGQLLSLVKQRVPLPFGTISNQRSFVYIENLVDFIVTCIDHPSAANEVFLASDGHDLSTTELLRGLAKGMGKRHLLFPVPQSLLMFVASILGKRAVALRLLGSLQVDISKARDVLGWVPPITVEEGLRRCFVHQSN